MPAIRNLTGEELIVSPATSLVTTSSGYSVTHSVSQDNL